MNPRVNFIAISDSSSPTPNVTSTPERKKLPQQVRIKINNVDTCVPWVTFMELLTCAHEFESNQFPTRAKHGNVEILLL